jgi:farnesyl diphosphate synthase
MDDDDLRRGRPTCHVAYDEATAVLVGDALQSLAFQLLAHGRKLPHSAKVRIHLVRLLAEALGSRGMAGGQALDVDAEGKQLTLPQLETMHALKTGALIRCSVLMAAACAPTLDRELLSELAEFASCIGLAFQIRDDLLDVTGDPAVMGKAAGADERRGKATYPSTLGVQASQARLSQLHEQALEALVPFGARAEPLRGLANWLLARAS